MTLPARVAVVVSAGLLAFCAGCKDRDKREEEPASAAVPGKSVFRYDAGLIDNSERVFSHRFVLANPWGKPLTVTSIKTCCSNSAQVIGASTAPKGGSITVEVQCTIAGRSGHYERDIVVETDNPSQHFIPLKMACDIKTVFEFFPKEMDLGSAVAGKPVPRVLTLWDGGYEEIRSVAVQPEDPAFVVSTPVPVSEELTRLNNNLKGWQVQVSVAPTALQGNYKSQLRVTLEGAKRRTVYVPVEATVSPRFATSPDRILWQVTPSTPPPDTTVVVKSLTGEKVHIKSSQTSSDSLLETNVLPASGSDADAAVGVRLKPAALGREVIANELVTIELADDSHTKLTVPVSWVKY